MALSWLATGTNHQTDSEEMRNHSSLTYAASLYERESRRTEDKGGVLIRHSLNSKNMFHFKD